MRPGGALKSLVRSSTDGWWFRLRTLPDLRRLPRTVDDGCRSHIVVVAHDQERGDTFALSDSDGLTEHLGRVASSPECWHDGVADVPT